MGMSWAMLRFSYCVVPVGNVPSQGSALTGNSSPRLAIITPSTSLTNAGAWAGTAGIMCNGARNCLFDGCVLKHTGGYAIHLGGDFRSLFHVSRFTAFAAMGVADPQAPEIATRLSAARGTDIATILYTSGTTGEPFSSTGS